MFLNRAHNEWCFGYQCEGKSPDSFSNTGGSVTPRPALRFSVRFVCRTPPAPYDDKINSLERAFFPFAVGLFEQLY